jgi:ElaB/YqjD/DUF883 family membrane-anchored ribosome-binding protein
MADQKNADLPEGTDQVIEGANVGALATEPMGRDDGGQITLEDTGGTEDRKAPRLNPDLERIVSEDAPGKSAGSRPSGAGGNGGLTQNIADRVRSGREQLASQAGERARGFVTQGLERTSEALANVAKMVGDTAPGIDDRLGEEYGEYARRAAGAIENVANAIAEKDPDELIEDTRTFVRNSPGVALAGAAVVGFVVARLLKTGLARGEDEEA